MSTMWLGEMVSRAARLSGDRGAFVEGGRRCSQGAYHVRCLKLAAALRARGARRQDRIAILSMNRIEFMELYGACELSGLIAATVNYRLVAAEIETQLRDAAPLALFYEAQYAEIVAAIDGLPPLCVCIDEDYEALLASGDADALDIASTPDDIAHLIYTSGSTGRPKGCMLGQRELARKAALHASDLGLTVEDRFLIVMPLFHVGARGVASAAQWRGAEVHLHRSFDPATFIRTVAEQKITIAHLAPTMVQMVLEHPSVTEHDMSSLRAILYSAAAMPLPVLRKGLALLGDVFHQSYGQTEGMVSSLQRCQHLPDGSKRERQWLQSVGQPYPGVTIRLLDDDGNEVPGGPGEIVYRGGTMFRGYWNDSGATIATLREGWIHSGDIGRIDADGFLYIVDRKKDMIVSGGENVYSREVEEALLAHVAVSEVGVIGVPHLKWGETVHAAVCLRPGAAVSEAALIAHCRLQLASYKKPTRVTFVDALPKMSNGKVDKIALRRMVAVLSRDAG